MKKLKLCIILLVVLHLNYPLHSQTYKVKDTILRTTQTQNAIYQARDRIEFGPGFVFDSQNGTGKTFKAEIREDLIFNADYQTSQVNIIDEYGFPLAVDTQLSPGLFGGTLEVSPTGAATYNIPLDILSGTNQMQPSLSIVYNSQIGNGILGMGWSLSGISAITRTGATKYYDGRINGVNLDKNDRFMLDGQRLISYGSIYYTEMESTNKILSINDNNNNPLYFTIETKEGQKMYYGHNDDSRIIIASGTAPCAYMLDKVEDINGNYVKYNYGFDEQTKEAYITSIEYTGNGKTNMSPYNKIEFHYDKRNDKNILYLAGYMLKKELILREIKQYSYGQVINSYKFEYVFNNNYSKLSKIYKYNAYGESLNPIIINYGTNDLNYDIIDKTFPGNYIENWDMQNGSFIQLNHEPETYLFGDFNNDGISDLLLSYGFRIDDNIENDRNSTGFKIFLGDGNGNYSTTPWYENKFRPQIAYNMLWNKHKNRQFMIKDMNGDGYDDIVESYVVIGIDDSPISSQNYYKITVYLRTPDNDTEKFKSYILTGYAGSEIINQLPQRYISGIEIADLDNNGLQDIIMQLDINISKPHYNAIDVFMIKEYDSTGHIQYNKTTLDITHEYKTSIYVEDVENNGYPELIVSMKNNKNNGEKTQIFAYKNNNPQIFEIIKEPGYPTFWHSQFYGDFNGDGYPDILTWVIYNDKPVWQIGLNNGKGDFITDIYPCPITSTEDPSESEINYNYYALDVNCDGMCDILEFYETAGNESVTVMNIYYSTGIGFDLHSFEFPGNYNIIGSTKFNRWINTNKDRYPDFIFMNHTLDDIKKILFFHPNNDEKLVKTIMDSYGNITEIDYRTCNDSIVYKSTLTGKYPITFKTLPLTVVNGVLLNKRYYKTYKYFDGALELTGKGFIGFMKTQITDYYNDRVTENFFNMTSFYSLYLEFITEKTLSNNELLLNSAFVYEFGHYQSFPRIYTSKLNMCSTLDEITGFLNEEIFKYDAYGNILNKLKIIYDGNNKLIYTERSEVSGYINSGSWCPYLPKDLKTIKSRPNEPDDIKKETYQYDSYGHLIKEQYDLGDPALNYEILYENYTPSGLPLSTKTTLATGESKASSSQYDETGRFIISSTNAANQKTYSDYDLKTGYLLSSTDEDGRIATYKYDNWGNVVTVTSPDGVRVNKSSGWFDNLPLENSPAIPENALLYSVTQTEGSNAEYTFVNKTGKQLRKAVQQPEASDYQWLYHDKEYEDDYLVKEYLPKPTADNSGAFTKNEYFVSGKDNGKIKKTTGPDGSYTNYTYEGSKITSVFTGGSVTRSNYKIVDATGLMIQASDAGGTINYKYYSDGNLKSLTHSGMTFTVEYNAAGQRTKLTDPSAGVILSKYNGWGERIAEQSAKQKTEGTYYKYTYDKLGRLQSRTLLKGSFDNLTGVQQEKSSYSYGAVNNINQLAQVSSDNMLTYYSYDTYGRLSQIRELILLQGSESKEFIYKYTYDSYGRLVEQTYPNDFKLTMLYDARGYQSGLNGPNDKPLYRITGYDVSGSIKQYKLGTHLAVNNNYDDKGRIIGSVIKKDNIQIDNMTYGYHPDGNMSYRSNGNLREEFEYDILDRLISSKVIKAMYTGTVASETISYTGNRIDNKTNAGTYTYNNRFAVDKITGPNSTVINPNNCTITYTSSQKISTITEADKQLAYYYGADDQRIKSTLRSKTKDQTKYYSGGGLYEVVIEKTKEKQYSYIFGADGVIGVYVTSEEQPDKLYYFFKDHLGSLIDVIEDNNGTCKITEQMSYDPWGRRRNPSTWTFTDVPQPMITDRGYCFHEHMDDFNLINMNGRVYDPLLAIFLSPDPYVQATDFTQNLNRYSYCFNNPLKYTDPDGEFVGLILGAVLGGINGFLIAKQTGQKGWNQLWYTLGGAVVGAASGGVGALAASSTHAIAGGAIGGLMAGTGFSLMSGYGAGLRGKNLFNMTANGMWQGALVGSVGSFFGGAFGGGWGAMMGGIMAGGFGTLLSGGSALDILKGAGIGGLAGFGIYHASLLHSFYASGIRKTGINYRQYSKMIGVTQRSMFWNREAKFIPNTKGGVTLSKLGDENFSGADKNFYSDAIFDYHTHQSFGPESKDGENFSTWKYGGPKSDEYARFRLNNEAQFKGPKYLGTKEGGFLYMYSDYTRGKLLSYNFANTFNPFNIAWTLSLYLKNN